jgi:anhydro-N-acetylmuramic acid kinase
MTGTSADSLDAALVEFHPGGLSLLEAIDYPLPGDYAEKVRRLADPSYDNIDDIGQLDREIALLCVEAVGKLLKVAAVGADNIVAIGSHGQTVRHRPPSRTQGASHAFTLQLGDPNTIAEACGITTVADFRRRDIAAGGQGAPLVPAFHNDIFRSTDKGRAVINIGGMANITLLAQSKPVTGYDTGPGNVLMDDWVHQQWGLTMDKNGQLAASCKYNQLLLEQMLKEPFFSQPPPRSTGRELFNPTWLNQQLESFPHALPAAEVVATLLELTATSIINELDKSGGNIEELLICGGGAFNPTLMSALQRRAGTRTVSDTSRWGLAPQWVEACAFAWLARQCLLGLPGNCPAVTGATHPVILGAIFPA